MTDHSTICQRCGSASFYSGHICSSCEQRRSAVYDAAMDLSDKLGDFWLGWFIAEDKLPEQYRPIVAAVDALVRECRRAKESEMTPATSHSVGSWRPGD